MKRPIILWDLMDTLVSDPFFTHMAGFFGLTFDELLAQKHPSAWGKFELGVLSEAEMFAQFFKDGRAFDGDAFKRHVASGYAWIDGMEQLVAELHAAEVEMHLLSNYPAWYALCTEPLGIGRYIAPTFVSCHTGVRKPDPQAYLGPCRTLGVRPEDCFFVDDREKNCEAAREVGMPAFRFERDVPALRAALRKHGLL